MPGNQKQLHNQRKKSRLSSAYKSQSSKKSLTHKQKIHDVIKNSTLKTSKGRKSVKSSKGNHSSREKKNSSNPYETDSHKRKRTNTINTVSRTVPVKQKNNIKLLQFPFQAIKFKEKSQNYQSRTHDGFFIQYDEKDEFEDNKIVENSKKIVSSYNQRISRYAQSKSTNNTQSYIEIKNLEFKEAVIKFFKFLDPHSTRVISHAQIDYKKVPQGVLYFLGGLFHRIRQKLLYLSLKEFIDQCAHIYTRSSKQDIQWFIDEVKNLSFQDQQKPKLINQQRATDTKYQKQTLTLQNSSMENNVKLSMNKNITRSPSNTEKPQLSLTKGKQKNLSPSKLQHQKESPMISFRKQQKQMLEQYHSRNSQASDGSFQSAKFGLPFENRFSFSLDQKPQVQIDFSKQKNNQDKSNHTFSFQQNFKGNLEIPARTFGIKKNIIDKTQDLREQIYLKLDKMRINSENKQNQIVKENFKNTATNQKNTNYLRNAIEKDSKQAMISSSNKKEPVIRNQISKQPVINMRQRVPLSQKLKENFYQEQKIDQSTSVKYSIANSSNTSQINEVKDSKWVNRIKNCQDAFKDLQRIKQQFKKQTNAAQQRQKKIDLIEKDDKDKTTPKTLQRDFIIQNETRVVKYNDVNVRVPLYQRRQQTQTISQKLQQTQKTFNYLKPQELKKNYENQQQSPILYEKNIDRLALLSKNQTPLSINLNDSLSSSCRKSVQITLPLRYGDRKQFSLSQKKIPPSQSHLSKIDKIDQLSQKLQQYLKKNAQKIQYSKNFTQSNPASCYNKILAL